MSADHLLRKIDSVIDFTCIYEYGRIDVTVNLGNIYITVNH